jgi:hypothetical protein
MVLFELRQPEHFLFGDRMGRKYPLPVSTCCKNIQRPASKEINRHHRQSDLR